MLYQQTLVIVEGEGAFPLDMLRFDSCVPYTTIDSLRLTETGKRRVCLRRFSVHAEAASSARWYEYGWTVVDDSGL